MQNAFKEQRSLTSRRIETHCIIQTNFKMWDPTGNNIYIEIFLNSTIYEGVSSYLVDF